MSLRRGGGGRIRFRWVLGAATLWLAFIATPAQAFSGALPDVPSGTRIQPRAILPATNLPYGGGAVLHANRTHVIFWQPSGSNLSFEPGYMSLINTFLVDVAADSRKPGNVYGLSGQYSDLLGPAVYNSTFGGSVIATDPLPPNGCHEPLGTGPGWTLCLTDRQLQGEVEHVVYGDHLPNTDRDVYFLVTPNGLGNCQQRGPQSCALGGSSTGYCGYHSQTWDAILYAVIPYNAVPGHCQSGNPRPNGSAADPAISTISHEHNEMVTDPLGDAWVDSNGSEDGDLCITHFGPAVGGSGASAWNQVIHGGHFYLQEEWSNEDNGCAPRDEYYALWFSAPVRARAKAPVQFAAHGRDPDGSITAYTWFFGAGRLGHRRALAHTFRNPGTYRVVLRATDNGGNYAFYARTIQVTRARSRGRAPSATKRG